MRRQPSVALTDLLDHLVEPGRQAGDFRDPALIGANVQAAQRNLGHVAAQILQWRHQALYLPRLQAKCDGQRRGNFQQDQAEISQQLPVNPGASPASGKGV